MSANRIRMMFVLAFIACAIPAAAQNGSITGQVSDENGRGIPDARVQATSGVRVAATAIADQSGNFRLSNVPAGTYSVTATRLGFRLTRVDNVTVGAGASATANIRMGEIPSQLEQVVTTASRVEEKVIDAPASVSVVTAEEINERPAVSVADHVAALPGVDVARGGLIRSNIVSRGFNNIFSGALLTLTDNRFAFVPSLRVNIPYLSSTTNEDIERIEVVLGPGAALYGPNTASGVMAMFTKSPFSSQGTTITLDGGNQNVLRGSFRTAWAPTAKFGFKASFDAFRGTEWDFLPADTLGERKPRDQDLNRYGGEVRVDFRPTAASEIIANYGRSKAGNAVEPTGLGPAQVRDWVYQTFQLRGRYKQLFAQTFLNTSDAGGTYLLQKVNPATNCPDVSDDACIIDKSTQLVGQIQQGWNLGARQRFLFGGDYIHTMPKTEGTINGRNDGDDEITEIGGYAHSVTQLAQKFELTTAARVDKHSRLESAVFSPRVALVFKPIENQSLRLTYNRAFSTPSTNNLFLDLVAVRLPPLLNIRALGTPPGGLQFKRNCTGGLGDLCMKVFPALGGTGTFVPANPYATSIAAARAGGLVAGLTAAFTASGVPNAATVAQLAVNFLASRTPGATDVGTNFIIPGVPGAPAFPVDPSQLVDISRPRPTIHNTIEAGYKGIIANRLQLALDVWHDTRENFVGPLQLETPLVFLNRPTLNGYLSTQLQGFFQSIGFPAPNAAALAAGTAASLSCSLPGSNRTAAGALPACPAGTAIPVGVVNFDTPNAGNDVIVAYRSYDKSLKLWGSDLGAELLLDKGFSLLGTYSWVNKKQFAKEEFGTREDVSLNAPANKHSFTVRYRNDANGLSGELRERHVDGFNTLAFIGGAIEPYTLVDAGISFRPGFLHGAMIAVNGTNILNKKHRQFTQGSIIGRLILTRLQMSF